MVLFLWHYFCVCILLTGHVTVRSIGRMRRWISNEWGSYVASVTIASVIMVLNVIIACDGPGCLGEPLSRCWDDCLEDGVLPNTYTNICAVIIACVAFSGVWLIEDDDAYKP